MNDKSKLPPTEGSPEKFQPLAGQTSENKHGDDTSSGKTGKLVRMLCVFASGQRIHRFIAEKLADHCLPTTISDLQKRRGISFSREWLTVPNRFGTKTRVRVYWLEGDSLERAQAIINGRSRP